MGKGEHKLLLQRTSGRRNSNFTNYTSHNRRGRSIKFNRKPNKKGIAKKIYEILELLSPEEAANKQEIFEKTIKRKKKNGYVDFYNKLMEYIESYPCHADSEGEDDLDT